MRHICVVGAMAEETAPLAAGIAGKNYPFKLSVITSGIGKVNAAAALAAELARADAPVDAVISHGSAGGIGADLQIGDCLISTTCCYHDVDMTPAGYEFGQFPGFPPVYESAPDLAALAAECAERLGLRHRKGLICTGDSFVAGGEKLAALKARFPAAMALEMESAALAQVCHRQKPAPRFISVRAVSDLADSQAEQSFDSSLPSAADNSAALVLAMLKHFAKQG